MNIIPVLVFFFCGCALAGFPWNPSAVSKPLSERIQPPPGCVRIQLDASHFGSWLRNLPIKPGSPRVMLYDGSPKSNQSAQFAVVDLDVGAKDLQQCADAVMRLRAEYLLDQNRQEELAFDFTNGTSCRWSEWRKGIRPMIRGNRVSMEMRAAPSSDYQTFRKWLETVFIYAGSASLVREMERVDKPSRIKPGDVFIQGGFPGHAVMVLDVAVDQEGKRFFLLGQSYMPAQDFHILKGPPGSTHPWYPGRDSGRLNTPEWTFAYGDLYRFSAE